MEQSFIEAAVIEATGCSRITNRTNVQSLWSGYGSIERYHVADASVPSVIVKHVDVDGKVHQPRGWNTNLSHTRKLRSYEIELEWYQNFSSRLKEQCRVADCHFAKQAGGGFVLVLEDLDASGYSVRHSRLESDQLKGCLGWLARFHSTFMNECAAGLWPVGTYWHLATRPDELAAMPAQHPLRIHASRLDETLSSCRYRTLVHGDAKVANFCFSHTHDDVAAVDFQYVGGGCGIKDVAYFLGSCLTEQECEREAENALQIYFTELRDRLSTSVDVDEVESEWRRLYPIAWADFVRFLLGWYPDHQKLHAYSRRMTDEALQALSR